jgi:predicted nucleic-acid-binding protein
VPQRKKASRRPAAQQALVDTNVILRFLVGDDPPKAARAAALMGRVERSEDTIEITVEVLTETVWTLESFYKVPRAEIAEKLVTLLTFPGVQSMSKELFFRALQDYATSNVDFVDCLLAAQSDFKKVPVYTFDEHDFKKLRANWKSP